MILKIFSPEKNGKVGDFDSNYCYVFRQKNDNNVDF
jgi:hypothetical protein